MLDEKAWLTFSTIIYPRFVQLGYDQDCKSVNFFNTTNSSMSFWTLLCALSSSSVGTGTLEHPQLFPESISENKIVQNTLVC